MGFGDKTPKLFGSLVFLNYLRGPKAEVEYIFFFAKYFALDVYITFKLLQKYIQNVVVFYLLMCL